VTHQPARRIPVEAAIEAIAQVMGRNAAGEVPALEPGTRLDELELTSADATEVFVLIEDMTGCVVATDDLPALETIADIGRLRCLDDDDVAGEPD
jgi:acyl carrier protein